MDKKHRRTEQRAGGRAVTAGRIRPLQNAAPPATQRSRPLLDDAHGLMAQNEPAPTESAPDEASRDEPGGDAAARPGDKDILPPEPSVPTATVTVQGGPADDQRHGSGHPDETNDRARARELFAQLVAMPDRTPERAEIRDQLVRMHLPLVEYLARRFRNRGEPLDDLTQVATIGLIKSVDRFDPERGVEFSTYATPTIVGEIKRHFRDKGWAIRVPRRLQELKLSLTKATSELSQTLGRSPTVSEIAAHLQMTEEEVLEGLESANAYSAVSLDAPDSGDDEAPAVADTLGVQDESLEGVEYRESLKPLLEKLPPREKRILLLRFFGNMTQSQIAAELGISQMHVSRLLARTLAQLRRGLLEDA
ncbi:RNA polymerase sigma factor SigF [Frankia sp. Cj5]|uniref:RNA polymerase sigma factor SigF n=2 Tax=unclassified Frankia TaxID=2632575 RepID=UPI001EF61EF9|nr:RNA polymerase sigma factor SigF [Frankia sp. Cj5]